VLVVDAAGQDVLRWAVEAAIDDRGWGFAASPAETDVVVVLGKPAPALADAIDVLWSQVPRPRHAVTISDKTLLDEQLDAAVEGLISSPSAADDADDPSTVGPEDRLAAAGNFSEDEPAGHDMSDEHAGHDMGGEHAGHDMGGEHAGHDMGGEHAGHDMGGEHAGHDMGGEHAGHDMGGEHAGHDMGGHGGHHMHHGGTVAGLAMAQTAPDRDGLELDTLAVALGPVLPGWPTGLVLRAQMQGDVLNDVRLSWVADRRTGTGHPTSRDDSQLAALDHLARFLVVAGWPRQARQARRALAGLRSADPAGRARAGRAVAQVARRVRRSRTLAWSVRGIGQLPTRVPVASDDGHSQSRRDVLDRVRQWCDRATQQTELPMAPVGLDVLAEVLEGAELAAARLVVASVALDPVDVPSLEAVPGG
jgi:hypothetical protein